MKKEFLDAWYKDSEVHDYLHRHPLSRDSLIVDIGSYKGSWIKHMCDSYGCICIGVEPIEEYAKESIKFQFINDVKIYNFGLTTGPDVEHDISVSEDASSIFILDDNLNKTKIKLKNAKLFFDLIDREIDVLQINAEGLEYQLVPYIIENKIIDKVKRIQVQFHDFYPSSEELMPKCINMIEDSGFTTKFNYDFVWYGAERNK